MKNLTILENFTIEGAQNGKVGIVKVQNPTNCLIGAPFEEFEELYFGFHIRYVRPFPNNHVAVIYEDPENAIEVDGHVILNQYFDDFAKQFKDSFVLASKFPQEPDGEYLQELFNNSSTPTIINPLTKEFYEHVCAELMENFGTTSQDKIRGINYLSSTSELLFIVKEDFGYCQFNVPFITTNGSQMIEAEVVDNDRILQVYAKVDPDKSGLLHDITNIVQGFGSTETISVTVIPMEDDYVVVSFYFDNPDEFNTISHYTANHFENYNDVVKGNSLFNASLAQLKLDEENPFNAFANQLFYSEQLPSYEDFGGRSFGCLPLGAMAFIYMVLPSIGFKVSAAVDLNFLHNETTNENSLVSIIGEYRGQKVLLKVSHDAIDKTFGATKDSKDMEGTVQRIIDSVLEMGERFEVCGYKAVPNSMFLILLAREKLLTNLASL